MAYKAYTGGAGPSKSQAEDNTLALAEKLSEIGIVYEFDREHAKQLWDGDDLNLKITKEYGTENEDIIYVGYDRWGFCVDNHDEGDQCSLEEVIEIIKNWLNED